MKKTFIALTVASLAAINIMAADVALSPRAADREIHTASGPNNDPNLATARPLNVSPRVQDSQIRTAAGTDTTVAPSLQCARMMTGSPKEISACADHPGAAMPCCSVAATK
jgi:hypothetical protein